MCDLGFIMGPMLVGLWRPIHVLFMPSSMVKLNIALIIYENYLQLKPFKLNFWGALFDILNVFKPVVSEPSHRSFLKISR